MHRYNSYEKSNKNGYGNRPNRYDQNAGMNTDKRTGFGWTYNNANAKSAPNPDRPFSVIHSNFNSNSSDPRIRSNDASKTFGKNSSDPRIRPNHESNNSFTVITSSTTASNPSINPTPTSVRKHENGNVDPLLLHSGRSTISRGSTVSTHTESRGGGLNQRDNRETPSASNIYSNISLKQTNYYIFNKMSTSESLKMAFLYAAARCVYESEESDTLIPAIAAAEYVSQYLPAERLLYGVEADLFFRNVMTKAIADPRFNNKLKVTDDLNDFLAEMGLSKMYPPQPQEDLTGEQCMLILRELTKYLQPWNANCDLVVLLTAIIPCVLKEKLTNSFTLKVQKIVQRELNKRVVVSNVSMDLFCKKFVRHMEEDNICEMVAQLRTALPADQAKELFALLKRKPGGGLLPITLIGKALTLCQDFPWRSTLDLYPNDWKCVDRAIREVDGDKFYGYRKCPHPDVDPKNYANLAWIAKSLCEQKLNENYDDYDEWLIIPDRADEANMLLSEYISRTDT